MANFLIKAIVGADITEFEKNLGTANSKLDGVQKSLSNAGKVATIGLTIPLVAASGVAINTSNQFSESMSKISTLYGGIDVDTNNLKKSIMSLSNQTGIAANEIAGGYYEALSAGLPVTNDMKDTTEFMTQAIQLSKGGFTDTASAVNVMTSAINAYGLEAKDSKRISDVLITTQNLGKTTVDELSKSMGNVIPTAKAYGVNIEQLGASYALMTAKGIDTAQSTTSINAMLNELGDTSSIAGAKILELTGKSFGQLMSEGKSVGDVLKIMDDYAKANGQSMPTMFGSIEAGKAAMTIAGDVGTYNEFLGKMGESAGATKDAFDKMNSTNTAKIQKAMAEITNAGIKLADVVAPAVAKLADKIGGLAAWFAELGPVGKGIVIAFVALGIAIGPVLGFISALIPIISFFTAAQTANATATGAAAVATWSFNAAILLIPLAIIAIIAAILWLWNNCEGFRNGVMAIVDAVGGFFKWLGGIIKTVIGVAIDIIVAYFKLWWAVVSTVIGFIVDIFKFIGGIIMAVVGFAIDIIVGYFQFWWSVVTSVINLIVFGFKWLGEQIWGFLKPKIDAIAGIFTSLWLNYISPVVEKVKSAFSIVASAISGAIKGAIDTGIGLFNRLKDTVEGIVDKIKGFFGGISGAISSAIGTAIDKVKGLINSYIIKPVNSVISKLNGALGFAGVNIKSFPYLAHGTDNWGGGPAWINEQGRGELVNLPNGTQVIPHDLSKRMIDQYSTNMSSMNAKNGGMKDKVVVVNDGGNSSLRLTVNLGEDNLIDKVIKGIENKSFINNEAVIKV
ncbi:MAG: phage tail tape measure protein family [Fusobacteria bacterium]|nr:MAG: phage tail tape measure protein family [Fusobacteriota bacterium]KAF0228981.1 MAG: phage tail tape measure protein [Fusobacteriota bacterium]